MGHCKDCKHWLRNLPTEERGAWEAGTLPQHEIRDLRALPGSVCMLVTDNEEGTQVINGDYADSAAWLYTMPDFGCVLWEDKP